MKKLKILLINIYPADKQDLKAEDDKGSAMDVMGLKPKNRSLIFDV